jgi:hypothetical protein
VPTQREVAVPLANYPSGSRTVAARNVPDWATHFQFEFARCTSADPTIWPNVATTLRIDFEVFVDGQWFYGGGYTAVGGVITDDDGELPLSFARFTLRPGVDRQIRGNVTITNGPLRTEGSIELVG